MNAEPLSDDDLIETRLILPRYVSIYKCNACGNKFQGRQRK